jgi:hypothetical protein
MSDTPNDQEKIFWDSDDAERYALAHGDGVQMYEESYVDHFDLVEHLNDIEQLACEMDAHPAARPDDATLPAAEASAMLTALWLSRVPIMVGRDMDWTVIIERYGKRTEEILRTITTRPGEDREATLHRIGKCPTALALFCMDSIVGVRRAMAKDDMDGVVAYGDDSDLAAELIPAFSPPEDTELSDVSPFVLMYSLSMLKNVSAAREALGLDEDGFEIEEDEDAVVDAMIEDASKPAPPKSANNVEVLPAPEVMKTAPRPKVVRHAGGRPRKKLPKISDLPSPQPAA